MGIVWMIGVGLTAGLVARALMPAGDAMETVMTLVLSFAGSAAGGFLLERLTNDASISTSAFQPAGLIGCAMGAAVVLGSWHLVRRRPA